MGHSPHHITERLEQGEVILLEDVPFILTQEEQSLLHAECVDSGSKSVKFFLPQEKMWGMAQAYKTSALLKGMLERYAQFAQNIIASQLSGYTQSLIIGNTSFRPVEAQGRAQSMRHDDRLLHIDAFPSRPMLGKRILRVFSNIHPNGRSRKWQTGEPFAQVASRFVPNIPPPVPGISALLNILGITKEKRSLYDYYMLKIHDAMKVNEQYQTKALHTDTSFPAGTSWLVFTDQVSHAVISGQYAMEQTFLLPPEALNDPSTSPLSVLESIMQRPLL